MKNKLTVLSLITLSLLSASIAMAQRNPQFPPADGRLELPQTEYAWCNHLEIAMNHDLRYAHQLTHTGNFAGANAYLKSRLLTLVAEATNGQIAGTFTASTIIRAQYFLAAVENSVKHTPNAQFTIFHFLTAYYARIQNVISQFDAVYQTPWHHVFTQHLCGRCGQGTLEKLLREFVTSEIDWAQKTFSKVIDGIVYPAGNEITYVKLLEIAMRFARDDLGQSVYARAYSCVFYQIDQLIVDLQAPVPSYRLPGHIQFVYGQIESILAQLTVSNCQR